MGTTGLNQEVLTYTLLLLSSHMSGDVWLDLTNLEDKPWGHLWWFNHLEDKPWGWVHLNPSCVSIKQKASKGAQQCALPAAVGAKQHMQLSALDLEVHSTKNLPLCKTRPQVLCDNRVAVRGACDGLFGRGWHARPPCCCKRGERKEDRWQRTFWF